MLQGKEALFCWLDVILSAGLYLLVQRVCFNLSDEAFLVQYRWVDYLFGQGCMAYAVGYISWLGWFR